MDNKVDVVFDYMNNYVETYLWDIIDKPDKYTDDEILNIFKNDVFEVSLDYIFNILNTFDLSHEELDRIYFRLRNLY